MYMAETNEDEMNIKEIFYTVLHYKVMIISFIILFGIGSIYYAYFKPNIYEATAIVEMGSDKTSTGSSDILNMAMQTGTVDVKTEMRIIQSRYLVEKALKNVDMVKDFFIRYHYKKIAIYYKNVPFEVGLLKGREVMFTLYPIDDRQYRLVAEKEKTKTESSWQYDAIHHYNEEIKNKYFQINIVRKAEEHVTQSYQFVFHTKKKVVKDILQNLKVSQEMQSNILSISFLDTVPQRAQDFSNALAEAYIQQSIERKTREAKQKLHFIDKQMKEITGNLRNSAIKLEDFKKRANTVSLSAKAENILAQMSREETQLTQVSMQEEMLDTLYRVVKKGRNLETLSFAGVELEGAGLSKLVTELQESIMKRKLLREDYTNMHPTVRKLSKKIIQTKRLLTSLISNLRKNIKEKKHLIQDSLAKKQMMLNELPADERRYGQLERKFIVNEKIYSYLLEKRSETAMIEAATVSKNRIIDRALSPEIPIKPKRKLIVAIGLFLGLLVGLGLAFLRAFLDDRIMGEEDIKRKTKIPVLGMIPHVKGLGDDIKVFESPKSAIAEAFRNLRTNLQFMGNEREHNVIAVTSTVGSEGKTTLSVNLAAILSMSGKKTIILNLDMRKPTLHKKFNLPIGQGLSSLLSERTRLSEVIQQTEYENLDVITSGPVPPNPSELIQGVLMVKILEKLKEVYDVIILDTPPVGLVTDARILMDYADMSVYVFRSDYSKKEYLQQLQRISQHKTLSNLGIVLNDIKSSKKGYGGYGYGYGYYEEDKK
ncbi:Tyrosine-protein kinase Wzc [hydrothermal vent metagenome]|uniref:non-specific protein-tyrosine kinase n=1 Tax=hydrothermal vent metagenome TaxID=652676 RepID=A0A1W1C2Z7_9ZZZZ